MKFKCKKCGFVCDPSASVDNTLVETLRLQVDEIEGVLSGLVFVSPLCLGCVMKMLTYFMESNKASLKK